MIKNIYVMSADSVDLFHFYVLLMSLIPLCISLICSSNIDARHLDHDYNFTLSDDDTQSIRILVGPVNFTSSWLSTNT